MTDASVVSEVWVDRRCTGGSAYWRVVREEPYSSGAVAVGGGRGWRREARDTPTIWGGVVVCAGTAFGRNPIAEAGVGYGVRWHEHAYELAGE